MVASGGTATWHMTAGIGDTSLPPHFPCRIFVPEYSATLRFALQNCTVNISMACAVRVTLGSTTLPHSFQKVLDCTGDGACSILLASPPWEKWLRITVESLGGHSTNISFEMMASFTGAHVEIWGLEGITAG